MTYRDLSDALFHGQLPMFMTGKEIKKHYQPLFADRQETEDEETGAWRLEHPTELWQRKSLEGSEWGSANLTGDSDIDSSLEESIAHKGVENPISLQFRDIAIKNKIGRPQVLGGHHRVAISAENHPNTLLPVEHFDSANTAQRSLGARY